MQFQKATKRQAKARVALIGPSGCGKTFTALAVATGLGGPIALVDTEHGSAAKYADIFAFDSLELSDFNPLRYIEAIKAAESAGYNVLILDSLSHAWAGKGGLLEFVDQVAKKEAARFGGRENSFAAWREGTPLHNKLIDAMLSAKLHLIVTMRTKTEYVQEKDERGKTTIRKVGIQPIQRDGLEYEFDVVGDMSLDHNLVISKTRCVALDGQLMSKPGADLAQILLDWLNAGEPQPATTETPKTEPEKQPAPNGNGSVAYPWSQDDEYKLIAWATEKKGINTAEILIALDVPEITAYPGTPIEACHVINAWIKARTEQNG